MGILGKKGFFLHPGAVFFPICPESCLIPPGADLARIFTGDPNLSILTPIIVHTGQEKAQPINENDFTLCHAE